MIVVSNLTKRFGQVTAVNNVSLEIGDGELTGIIGPDGAGKTTFLRMIAGALMPDSGLIEINGKNFKESREELKKEIGFLSQTSLVYGDLSVWENIEFFARIHKVPQWQKKGKELLEFAQLIPFKDRLADQLSGGMRQKLGICCAIIHQPRFLILDEPTTGVDPVSRRELWIMMSSFLKSSMTIVLATPYLLEAEHCSKVGLFSGGELLRYDSVENLRREARVQTFEIRSLQLKPVYEFLRNQKSNWDVMVMGDRISLSLPADQNADEILRQLQEHVDPHLNIEKVRPTLENVFTELMKNQSKGVKNA
ncbi:MAG: ABC transporter ATP-binding protein [Candidatus Kryptoniota bacterium]